MKLNEKEKVLIYANLNDDYNIADLYNYIEGEVIARREVTPHDDLYEEATVTEYSVLGSDGAIYVGNYKYATTKKAFFLRKNDLVEILINDVNKNKRIMSRLDNINNMHFTKIDEIMNNTKKKIK